MKDTTNRMNPDLHTLHGKALPKVTVAIIPNEDGDLDAAPGIMFSIEVCDETGRQVLTGNLERVRGAPVTITNFHLTDGTPRRTGIGAAVMAHLAAKYGDEGLRTSNETRTGQEFFSAMRSWPVCARVLGEETTNDEVRRLRVEETRRLKQAS